MFLAPYPIDKAPSQRLKYEQYYQAFQNEGHEIETKSFISEKFWSFIYKEGHLIKKLMFTITSYFKRFVHLFTLRKYDVVYIHLWVTPFGFPIFEFFALLLSKKVIYDIDDMIFLGHASKANRLVSLIKGKNKIHFLLKKANHVITCTPFLDAYARNFNQNTTDISSTIDTELYIPEKKENNNQVVLGWSGSYSTSKYLKLLEPVFIELLGKIEFKVLVIGDENFEFENNRIPVETLPWKLDSEVANLNRIDIGLYPLPDEPWVYGKSGLKALQYMSLGIPTIAQDIQGANQRIIQHSENGFLADTNLNWLKFITELYADFGLRKRMGAKAKITVENKYSIKSTSPIYLKIIDEL